jgi:hypothetical protein
LAPGAKFALGVCFWGWPYESRVLKKLRGDIPLPGVGDSKQSYSRHAVLADKLRELRSPEDLLDFWNERYRRYSSMNLTVSAMLARVVR